MENLIIKLGWYVEPIFYKMLYMSIIACFMGIAILATKKILKNKLSYKRVCVLWLLFIICLTVPVKFRTYVSVYNAVPIYFENIENKNPTIKNRIDEYSETDNYTEEEILQCKIKYTISLAILIIWLLAMVYYLLAYICGYIGLRISLSKQKNTDERLIKILENCKRELNIRKDVILVNSKSLKLPAIYGIFKIKILISEEIIALSDKDIYNIFLHELSHYERKDIIFNFVITVLKCAYIFNPIIWLLFEKLKEDIELATDEYALYYKNEEEKAEYIHTLEKIEKFSKDKFFIKELCVVEKKKILNKRIKNIQKINGRDTKKDFRLATIIFAMLFLIFLTKGENYKTQEELLKLCEKNLPYDNVKITREFNDYSKKVESETVYTEIYWKEARRICKQGDFYEYYNCANNKRTTIDNKLKTMKNEYLQDQVFSIEEGQKMDTGISSLNNISTIYSFLGREKLRGRDAYKILFVSNSQNCETILWIDKETYLVLKKEDKMFNEYRYEEYYHYDFDCVTDEEAKTPNIKDYPGYEIVSE